MIYRGRVVHNEDPLGLYRLRVQVPQKLGEEVTGWAYPVAPSLGTPLRIPEVGETVWVGFEADDPNHPLWFGQWVRDEDRETMSEIILDGGSL